MIHIEQVTFLPTIDSFQSSIPLTSTPKRCNRTSFFPPLSSTLSTSSSSAQHFDLSISAICSDQRRGPTIELEKKRLRRRRRQHRITHLHHFRGSSTLKKQVIDLKCLLYSNRAMRTQTLQQHRHYTEAEMKIYLV